MDAVKLVAILFVVGVLIYRKYQLGIALIAGTAVIGVLYGVPLETWLNVPYATVTSVGNLHLVAALYFIVLFENILRSKGMMTRLLNNFKALLPDVRAVLVVIPPLIGLLPSFGGALFSAPLIKEAARDLSLSKEHEFIINYWFRHLWEYFLPIFPGILLAAAILSIPTREIVVNFFYFAILMLIIGIFFLIRPIPRLSKENQPLIQNKKKYLKDLIFVLSPIISILILVIHARWEVTWAVLLIIVILFIYYRYSLAAIKKEFVGAFELRILSLVGGVLLFKEMMIQSGAVAAIVTSFDSWGITGVIMVGILSLLIGFMTGSSQGPIGAVYPLILSFPEDMRMPLAMVGLVCAAGGHMLSPMHLCLAVTQEYFDSSYIKVLPKLAALEAIMISSAAVAYYFW